MFSDREQLLQFPDVRMDEFPSRPASVKYKPADSVPTYRVLQLVGETAVVANGLPPALREKVLNALRAINQSIHGRLGG